MSEVGVLLAAAGSGRRMGADHNKQYLPLAGRPLLAWCLDVFEASPLVGEVVVMVAPGEEEFCRARLLKAGRFDKISQIVAGGPERQDSVALGLARLSPSWPLVAVHDGARPLIDQEALGRVVNLAREKGAAALAVPARDTVKVVDQEGSVRDTLPRDALRLVQTPQVFRAEVLRLAYRQAQEEGWRATDDASLVEKAGHRVWLAEGNPGNLKVTYPEDLIVAEALLQARAGE